MVVVVVVVVVVVYREGTGRKTRCWCSTVRDLITLMLSGSGEADESAAVRNGAARRAQRLRGRVRGILTACSPGRDVSSNAKQSPATVDHAALQSGSPRPQVRGSSGSPAEAAHAHPPEVPPVSGCSLQDCISALQSPTSTAQVTLFTLFPGDF